MILLEFNIWWRIHIINTKLIHRNSTNIPRLIYTNVELMVPYTPYNGNDLAAGLWRTLVCWKSHTYSNSMPNTTNLLLLNLSLTKRLNWQISQAARGRYLCFFCPRPATANVNQSIVFIVSWQSSYDTQEPASGLQESRTHDWINRAAEV